MLTYIQLLTVINFQHKINFQLGLFSAFLAVAIDLFLGGAALHSALFLAAFCFSMSLILTYTFDIGAGCWRWWRGRH
jgi:hypothetical protein